jgi:hypothetical protein
MEGGNCSAVPDQSFAQLAQDFATRLMIAAAIRRLLLTLFSWITRIGG